VERLHVGSHVYMISFMEVCQVWNYT